MRLDILKFLHKMRANTPGNRPTLEGCSIFFKEIYQELIKTAEENIALISLAELRSISDDAKYQRLFQALDQVDQVVCVETDTQPRNKKSYLFARRNLEQLDVILRSQIMFSPGKDFLAAAAELPAFDAMTLIEHLNILSAIGFSNEQIKLISDYYDPWPQPQRRYFCFTTHEKSETEKAVLKAQHIHVIAGENLTAVNRSSLKTFSLWRPHVKDEKEKLTQSLLRRE